MSSKRYEPLLDDGAGGEKRSFARCLLPVTLVLGALCVAAVIAIPILLTSTSVSAPPKSISFAPIAPVAASNERSAAVGWTRSEFDRALEAWNSNVSSVLLFSSPIGMVSIPTIDIVAAGESISWTGSGFLPNFEQESGSLSFSGSILKGVFHLRGAVSFVVSTDPSTGVVSVTKTNPVNPELPDPKLPPTPPVPSTDAQAPSSVNDDNDDDDDKLDDIPDTPAPLPPAQPLEGSNVPSDRLGSLSGSVGGSFQRLRILVLFDKATCTDNEKATASLVESNLLSHWSNNMNMRNWELVYTCRTISDGSGSISRNDVSNIMRSEEMMSFRRRWGADLCIVVANFAVTAAEPSWVAGGDLGPDPGAVTMSLERAVTTDYVLTHELGHNFGMGHDRYNVFTTSGTYTCDLTSSNTCAFGYQASDYMTIMSYGTVRGGCNGPTNPRRIYVFSGYPLPGSSRILGQQSGPGCTFNRGVFEGNWNRIANYANSNQCQVVTCPSPVPPTGCVCSNPDAALAAQTRYVESTTYRANTDYTASGSSQVSLVFGEQVTRISGESSGSFFVYVRKSNGATGYVPRRVVDEVRVSSVSTTTTTTTSSRTTSSRPATSAPSSSTSSSLLYATSDYTARTSSEASVRRGERLRVVTTTDFYWIRVTNTAGATGWIPRSITSSTPPSTPASTHSVASTPVSDPNSLRVTTAYAGSTISVTVGQIVTRDPTAPSNSYWVYVRSSNGAAGWIPINTVTRA